VSEPLINGVIRAMVVLESATGLPRDRCVNVFHFLPGGTTVQPVDFSDIQLMLADFFTHVHTNGHSVGEYISPVMSRTANASKVKCYDLGTALPRVLHEGTFTLPTAQASSFGLPEEVACTASFYSDRNIRRQRGRVYIGPLISNSIQTTTPVSVHSNLSATLNLAAQRLKAATAASQVPGPEWAVLSRKDLQARSVTAGWVDNAFDTQRRRGPRSTARASWT